jgi:hypothetical protein
VEDLRLHHGKVARTGTSPPPYPELTWSYVADGLRIREESDFVTFGFTRALDGKVDYQYPPPSAVSNSCLSGSYTFQTQAPSTFSNFSFGTPLSGKLVINGSTTAQFYSAANVPPTLPVPQHGMLLHLEVRNAGAFDYDSADTGIVNQNAQCGL